MNHIYTFVVGVEIRELSLCMILGSKTVCVIAYEGLFL